MAGQPDSPLTNVWTCTHNTAVAMNVSGSDNQDDSRVYCFIVHRYWSVKTWPLAGSTSGHYIQWTLCGSTWSTGQGCPYI